MKRLFVFLTAFFLAGSLWAGSDFSAFKDGDIIFQNLYSSQSDAIQLATGSPYSHVGIIFYQDDKPYVLEAISTVHYTPLEEWIARGVDEKYLVKRLKSASVLESKDSLEKLRKATENYRGKLYDWNFEWSDQKIYCSELVWKLYDQALGIQVGKVQKLKDFNIEDPMVALEMKARYGSNVPLEEPVISPGAIFESDKLMSVVR